jgi:hypothetical protein
MPKSDVFGCQKVMFLDAKKLCFWRSKSDVFGGQKVILFLAFFSVGFGNVNIPGEVSTVLDNHDTGVDILGCQKVMFLDAKK